MANPQRENGSTDIANEIMEALCAFRVPGELRQILDAIIRKTYGWHKTEDFISNSQIMKMTGLLKGNVSRGLSKLITHKLVIKTDNKLKLNKNYEQWISFKKLSKQITNRKLSNVITGVIKTDNPVIKTDTKVIKSEGHKTNYTKQTYTKQNITKEKYSTITAIDDITLSEIAEKYQVPLSFVSSKLDDMTNWLEAKGKRYKNYKAALANWVKKDMLQIKQQRHDKSKIVFINPK